MVLIDENAGLRPRVVSKLFKELFSENPNSRLERLLLDR
uniref:Uncharacterized protein n=1 Tax=Rhizobium rhizogenes TaxID=359 RepID=A0A7S5DR58_RHIRH|nr:hypothetical protein pC6.5c_645 [Rhizobium rhizogenes]